MLTNNEKLVLRMLLINTDYSINQIANECNLSPNGALKILRKFEKEGILISKDIANIKSYRINFANEKTSAVLELALISEPEGRVRYRLEDFKVLKETAKCCVLFGSYISLKKEPKDIDVLFILDKADYKEYKKKLAGIREIVPAKVHDVVQTEEDLRQGIIRKDAIISEILRLGVILWGQKIIVGVVKDACSRQA